MGCRWSVGLLCLSLAPLAVGAPRDYCDEINLNPDLEAGNSRIYNNERNELTCNLGSSLPGFGSVPVSSGRECQEIRMRGEGVLDDVVELINDGLESLDVTDGGEHVTLSGDDIKDFFGTNPRVPTSSGGMRNTPPQGWTSGAQPQPYAPPPPQPPPQSRDNSTKNSPQPYGGYFD